MYTEQFIRFTTATNLSDDEWETVRDWLTGFFYDEDAVDVVREIRLGDGTLTEYVMGYEYETDDRDHSSIPIFIENHPRHEDRYYSVDGIPIHIDGVTSMNYRMDACGCIDGGF